LQLARIIKAAASVYALNRGQLAIVFLLRTTDEQFGSSDSILFKSVLNNPNSDHMLHVYPLLPSPKDTGHSSHSLVLPTKHSVLTSR